jgi:predicted kinase
MTCDNENHRNVLIVTVGLPRSGKSTWSQQQGVPVVCPDSIRYAIHGDIKNHTQEPKVWEIVKIMVKALFHSGSSTIILDATSVDDRSRKSWISEDWEIRYKIFNTPKEVCIQRALDNGQEYLVPVIERVSERLTFPENNILE